MTTRKENTQGWLKRRSQRLHTWSRRWFVLSDKYLFIYSREDDKKHQDVVELSKQIIAEPPLDPNDPKVGYFDIVNESSPSETLSLCAETTEEKKMWLRALKRAMYADRGGALFSQSLEEILFWEHQEGRQIPYIVDECVEYLYKYGLDAEGLFRLGGRMAAIKETIARFERGEKIKFEDENTDVHVVSSVFKTFLRDLPDSIIPCAFFQRFMNVAMRYMDNKDTETKERCIEDLSNSMKDIPKENYIILKYICNFLSKVADHEKATKMNSLNIGTIFGPNLIRHIDNENPHLHLCTADLGQHLVHMMLKYFSKVFVLEYSDTGTIGNNVPTADLLRMSRVIDVPVPAPRKKHISPCSSLIEELEGIDLRSQLNIPGRISSNGSSSLFEDFYSAPSSPLVDIKEDDVFSNPEKGNSRPLLFKDRSLHLSLKGTKHNIGYEQPSPTSDTLGAPIPPARMKSKKLMRNRRVLDRPRPNVAALFQDRSSPFYDHPEAYNSNEELNSDCNSIRPKSSTLPPGMTLSSHELGREETTTTMPSEEELPASTPVFEEESSSLPNENELRSSKLGPGLEDMKLQVTVLKEEINSQREKYRSQVDALKAQLTEMQARYEYCIETMEAEYKTQKQELENKLEKERLACSVAVERTVRLKEELHKYQMQYGELPQ